MDSDFSNIEERVDAQFAELRARQLRKTKATEEAAKEAAEKTAREVLSGEIRELDVKHRNLVIEIQNLDQRLRVACPRSDKEMAEHEAELYRLKSMLEARRAFAGELSRKRADLGRLQ